MARSLVSLVAGLTLVLSAPTATLAAQIGLLDPGFGGDGRVTTDLDPVRSLEDSANAVVVQADGKIVVAGSLGCPQNTLSEDCSMAVARYGSDGTLDTSFSGDGVVLTHFSSGAVGLDVALQDDGKIVVVGSAHAEVGDVWAFAVARYQTNGVLDPTFSGDGRVRTVPGGQFATSLAIQTDGMIVAAGDGIVRYETDGSLDTGFGIGGRVDTPFMTDVAIQPDDKIVTSGFAFRKFAVYRYETDGTPDATLDGDGKATLAPSTGSAKANSLALQPNGKIVVAGAYRKEPGIRRFALGRFTATGAVDVAFGRGDGFIATRIGGQHAEARGVALQPDGRILAAGASWYGSTIQDNADVSSFAVARYKIGGVLDHRFSGDGKIVTFVGNGFRFEQATSVALQLNGAIVVVGEAGRHEGDFGVVRYVVPANRPDASIKQRSRPFFIGDDVYGGAVSRQTWIANVGRGTSFLIRAENDGSDPDRFVFDGCDPTSGFTVRYFFGGSPVTRRVVAGTFERGPVAPGAEVKLRLEIHVRASTPDGARLACRVSVTSTHDATKSDVVRSVVFAGPAGCFPQGIRSARNEILCLD
jgi:uncharacterized delta-60 repeat protein